MKKILGIGNALVDVLIPLENEERLRMLDLPKGSMQLVDRNRSRAILDLLKDYSWSKAAGGSAANTIHGLARLGAETGYIGVIGEDELGGSFVKDMIDAGVEPHLIHSTEETGRAVALITPDSERTFATYLGAAIGLTAEHLEQASDFFSRYDLLHLEGYLVQNHDLVKKALLLARQHRMKVSLDLASYNVVEANREFLDGIIREFVDVVFANEEEAKAFTGKDPKDALDAIGEICEIAVVKTGKNGSLVRRGREMEEIGIIPVIPVDTTGAGDLYASGFLYGLAGGLPLKRCGETGALLAGHVIEVMGAKLTERKWQLIRDFLVSGTGEQVNR
jgi:sugar/nucleoside kinase (ribokinase family)